MRIDPTSQDLANLLAGRGPDPYKQRQLEVGIELERLRLGERPYLLISWVADFDYDGLTNYLALINSFETAIAAVQAADKESAAHMQGLLTTPSEQHRPPWQKWEGRELGAMHLPQLSPPAPVSAIHSQGFALFGGPYDRYYKSFIVLGPFPSGAVSRELITTLKQNRHELWAYLTEAGEKIVPYVPPPFSPEKLTHQIVPPLSDRTR